MTGPHRSFLSYAPETLKKRLRGVWHDIEQFIGFERAQRIAISCSLPCFYQPQKKLYLG